MQSQKQRTRIALELPKELREQLENFAEREDRTISSALRQILVRFFAETKRK